MTYDVIIIGTGPAGLTAGAYAGRSGLDVLFLEEESIGGELVNRHEVRSYPGFPEGVAGTDLRSKMVEEVEKYDPEVQLEGAEGIEPGEPHIVRTPNNEYEGKAVIIATGSRSEQLGVPGEEEYEGRGIFYCATCDGPLYQGERIAVVGGGNHALIDAVFLTEYATEVVVLESAPELTADETLINEAQSHTDVEIKTGTEVLEIEGSDGVVDGVRVAKGDSEETIPIGGLNVNTGSVPNSDFVKDVLALDDEGGIVVDQKMESDVDGIFAAGDVRQDSPLEIAGAVGDGVSAIQAAKRFIAESSN